MKHCCLDGENLNLELVEEVAKHTEIEVTLTEGAKHKVERAELAVLRLVDRGEIVYGVTTGFGAFKDRLIPLDQVTQLQHNILMSHITNGFLMELVVHLSKHKRSAKQLIQSSESCVVIVTGSNCQVKFRYFLRWKPFPP